jgi:hypothetical protein
MATYKQIQGTAVQNYTNDPANPVKGQLWYNDTANSFKYSSISTTGSWSTGGDLNTARDDLGGAGIQTAALGFGGFSPPYQALTESYDGTSWTEVNDLNTARRTGGSNGTQTSALYYGGQPTPTGSIITESWNGTSWTEVNDLNRNLAYYLAGAGADNTSALAFGGGTDNPVPVTSETELWNGTSWTEVNDLNTARAELAGAGIQTAALAFGGDLLPGSQAVTESWNGTSWTEVNDLNLGRDRLGGAGTQTSALAFGGFNAPDFQTFYTESWNGTSWSTGNNLNTGRGEVGSAGSSNTSSLAFGGATPSQTAATEEWGAGAIITKTITTS